MSQYSETIGSFIRTGSYPLEANYVFNTYEDLVNFYNDPINKTTLHIGLLKVVRSNNSEQQSLYWVTNSGENLEFVKLLTNNSISNLQEQISTINSKLIKEIADRKEILDGNLSGFPESLNNLMKIVSVINTILEDTNSINSTIQTIVGTSNTDIVQYLSTLPITNLTDLITIVQGIVDNNINGEEFLKNLKIELNSKLNNLQVELNTTQIGVGLDSSGSYSPDQETNYLKTSTSIMNALKTLDLLLHSIKITYKSGVLSILVNDEIISSQNISIGAIIDAAYYDQEKNSIIISFKLSSGESEDIEIPLDGIIKKWDILNNPDSVITLNLTNEDPQILTADINISDDPLNVLAKDQGKLLVKVTTNKIMHNDLYLSDIIEQFNWYEGE